MNAITDRANPWVKDLPTYEPGRPVEEVARELGFESADEIDKLASNENALGPAPSAIEAMRAVSTRMHRYPDGGAFYLKQALAKKLDVAPEMILAGNGSNELIELIAHVYLGPGAGIVTADHAFVVYRLIAASSRADAVSTPMKALTYDLDAVLAAITPETAVVFISNPNNPTGTMVDGDEIDAFMARVPEHVVTCFDEAYVELLPPERQPDTLRYVREGRSVIVLRTFSKAYGLAGLRIGYGVAPAECIKLLHKTRQPFNVNAMAQAAALAALDDEEHVAKTRRMVADGLKYFETECARLELPIVPSVVNFLLVEVGEGRRVFEELMKEGVIVRPMDGYGLPRHVRITVGTRRENERCIRALERVRGRG